MGSKLESHEESLGVLRVGVESLDKTVGIVGRVQIDGWALQIVMWSKAKYGRVCQGWSRQGREREACLLACT